MAVVKIASQKVKRYGKDKLCIQIPNIFADDHGIELGEKVPLYRGQVIVDGKQVDCIILTTSKQMEVDSH